MSTEHPSTDPEFTLVRCVVYQRLRSVVGRRPRIEYKWHRRSVPPDATPGKRSTWPPTYPDDRLPTHERVDAATARQIMEGGLARLREIGAKA